MNSHQFGALLEDIDDKLDAVIESLSFMATKAQLDAVDERLKNVESDVKIIKGAVQEHSRIFQQHGMRLQKTSG